MTTSWRARTLRAVRAAMWGEVELARIPEAAGMMLHVDFAGAALGWFAHSGTRPGRRVHRVSAASRRDDSPAR